MRRDFVSLVREKMKLFSRQPAPVPTTLSVEGMSCSACVAHVEGALRAVPGVASAQVDLESKRVLVTGAAPQNLLLEAVEEAGYSAQVASK